MNRKTSMRDAYAAKLRQRIASGELLPNGKKPGFKPKPREPRKRATIAANPRQPIKQRSDKRAKEEARYGRAKREHFAELAKRQGRAGLGPLCEVGGCLMEAYENHHKAGKVGRLLYYKPYFMAVCRPHHDWITANGKEAERLGYVVRGVSARDLPPE